MIGLTYCPLTTVAAGTVLFDADLCQLYRTSTTDLCLLLQLSSWLKISC